MKLKLLQAYEKTNLKLELMVVYRKEGNYGILTNNDYLALKYQKYYKLKEKIYNRLEKNIKNSENRLRSLYKKFVILQIENNNLKRNSNIKNIKDDIMEKDIDLLLTCL